MRCVVEGGQGFALAFRGVAFLWQQRVLWKWAILPVAVNVVVFAAAFALFLYSYPDLYNRATSFLPLEPPAAWYAWLWVAPLRLLAWVIGLLLLVTALVVIYFAFLLLGTVLAAPFLDVLAQRVEALVASGAPAVPVAMPGPLQAMGHSVSLELRKLGFFLAVQMVLFLLGLLPLLTPLTVLAATLFTMLFLPLEYAGFAMDHRQLRFAQRRALIWRHGWLMLGFGAAAFLTMLVPLVNFICLPALVVGGTLLFLHTEGVHEGGTSSR
jgi:CysZ protein